MKEALLLKLDLATCLCKVTRRAAPRCKAIGASAAVDTVSCTDLSAVDSLRKALLEIDRTCDRGVYIYLKNEAKAGESGEAAVPPARAIAGTSAFGVGKALGSEVLEARFVLAVCYAWAPPCDTA